MLRPLPTTALIAVTALWAATAAGDSPQSDRELAQQDRIAALERKMELLTEELARVRSEVVVPEETPSLTSYQGLGPAASKVYELSQGISLGGYAEAYYRNFVGDESGSELDQTDALRTVFYVGYKFNDWLVFNSEFEFEHGTTSRPQGDDSNGSVSAELAALDLHLLPEFNLRGGLLLIPVGFINEIHEPPFFHGVIRPQVEQRVIPTTWREVGAGFFGSLGEDFEYRAYVTASLDSLGADAGSWRGARQKGNRERAEDLAVSLRADWRPFPGALVGASVYTGEVDHDRPGYPDARLTLYEIHGQLRTRGFELRALFTQAFLSRADELTLALRADPRARIGGTQQTLGGEMLGAYLEAAYDIMPWIAPDRDWALLPFLRFEYYNTQRDIPSGSAFSADGRRQVRLFNPGLTFKPHPNVALKLDYRNFNPVAGERADEIQAGFGVAF